VDGLNASGKSELNIQWMDSMHQADRN
jgi:hypothetical protein